MLNSCFSSRSLEFGCVQGRGVYMTSLHYKPWVLSLEQASLGGTTAGKCCSIFNLEEENAV